MLKSKSHESSFLPRSMKGPNFQGKYQCARIRIGIIIFSLLLVSVFPVQAYAGSRFDISGPTEEEGIVKLVATLHDSPAFTDVVWKLYRLDLPELPVLIIPRHSAIVNLQPGNYRAVALLKSIVRSRLFNLESKGVEEVILSMDELK